MKKLIFAIPLLLSAIASPPASAENLLGFGNSSCVEYLATIENRPYRSAYTSWAAGFMSGANAVLIQEHGVYYDVKHLNIDLLIGSITAFCQQNPNQIVVDAIQNFFLTLPIVEWSP